MQDLDMVVTHFPFDGYDHSPHVKDIKLPISAQAIDWAYFLTALIHTNNWNLHSLLPEDLNDLDHHAKVQYFECVSYLHSNLRKLELAKGMIAAENYALLQRFEKLDFGGT